MNRGVVYKNTGINVHGRVIMQRKPSATEREGEKQQKKDRGFNVGFGRESMCNLNEEHSLC